ncbi:TIGR02302 family protein [Novispirillum sp. DQ9]|uniref:TIGR02302 family protein n=1 Tax=Novispirillum sp. DQ9 TaxID=3398612 RepID=UPI003C7E27C3
MPSITRRLTMARAALVWERLWAGLWPAVTIAGLFLALALGDVLPRLPGWVHAALLVLFGLAFLAAVGMAARAFRWPTGAEAARRLESSAPHRPLTASRDGLAQGDGDPVALALWQAHARRAATQARGLRAVVPHPGVPARDPFGLRAVPVLALFVAGVAAWSDPWPRVARAFAPSLQVGAGEVLTVDLWVTPPDHTRQAPFYRAGLKAGGEGADGTGGPPVEIDAPEGSRLLLIIHGADDPTVRLGTVQATPEALADASHRLETLLQPTGVAGTLAVIDGGRTLAEWPLRVAADQPPTVAFAKPPDEGPRWRLRLPFTAADDHGLATLSAVIARDGISQTIELPLPPGQPALANGQPMVDLTAHPWAGQDVLVRLVVADATGRTGATEPVPVTLPERQFTHPVAQELARQRKLLLNDGGERFAVAGMLDAIAAAPGQFDGDPVVFLALRVAAARLRHARDTDTPSVAQILWQTAVRIEEGGLAEAEERLAEAEKALEQALEQGADPQEIQRLAQDLKQALAEFMREMMANMPEMDPGAMPDIALPQDMIDPTDMARMLDQLGDMAEIGAQDAAREMMRQLRQMLQALRNAQPMPSQAAQEMQEIMRQLRDLADRQEDLLNETFRTSRETPQARDGARERPPRGQRGEQGERGERGDPAQGARLAEQQEALRRALGDVMGRIGEQAGQVPDNLGEAELDMRQAGEALAGQSWVPAEEAQGRALEALRKGAGEAMQQMMQAMGQGGGMMMMPFGQQPGMGTDPLGRGLGGLQTEGTEIPTEPDARRARDILMELRRRSNDLGRPGEERDYLRRLLRQF